MEGGGCLYWTGLTVREDLGEGVHSVVNACGFGIPVKFQLTKSSCFEHTLNQAGPAKDFLGFFSAVEQAELKGTMFLEGVSGVDPLVFAASSVRRPPHITRFNRLDSWLVKFQTVPLA